MKLSENSSIEEIVRESLSHHYSAFATKPNAQLVADIAALLNDPSNRHTDGGSSFESDAAYQVRVLLLRTFAHGVASVKSVIDIFNKLERAKELGWLAK